MMDTHDAAIDDDTASRISRIRTQWSVVAVAHQPGAADAAQQARATLAARYASPVYRYLARVLQNPIDAEDAAHEIMLRLMQGQFSNVDPARGRFRDYLKAVIRNVVADHFNRRRRQRSSDVSLAGQVAAAADVPDVSLDETLRSDVLQLAWQALDDYEKTSGKPYASALRFRMHHPSRSITDLTEHLNSRWQLSLSNAGTRKVVQRAREKLAELVVADVRQLLPPDERTRAAIECELADLGLLDHCGKALDRLL